MAWFNLLGNKGKIVAQDGDGSLRVTVNNQSERGRVTTANTKRPSSLLELEIIKDANFIVWSAGSDDYLYGINAGNKRPVRTNDGFETVEYGYDFYSEGLGEIEFVTKTPTGFVVATKVTENQTGAIYHSEDFESGFEKVLDLTNGYPSGNFIPRPLHNVDGGILMVGEYSTLKDINKLPRAFISRDGGLNWSQIAQVEVVDPTINFHFHGMCYDPWQARIYLSNGDYGNRKLQYSDDFGDTWHKIDSDTQPTLLEPMKNRIVTAPDANDTVSLNTIEKQIDNDYTVTPYMKKKINIAPQASYMNFGKGPVGGIVGSDEMYITFEESGGGAEKVSKTYVVATGDGGESFHLVSTLDPIEGTGLTNGLITDPNTGYMYGSYVGQPFGDGSWQHLVKAKPLTWE